MKKRLLLALFCLCGLISAKAENINILLEKNVSDALLEIRGPYYVYNPNDNSKVSSGLLSKRFMVRATEEGIKWGEEFIGIKQIRVIPRKPETSLLLNGIQYEGAIAVYKDGKSIKVINEVDVEAYLKSILSDNFPCNLEEEALNAAAIVERTNAYFQIYKNKNYVWHLDRKAVGYNGSALIIPDAPIIAAIDATHDLILVNPAADKKPFAAVWTEHSAGKTAPYKAIFRQDLNAPNTGVKAPLASLDRQESVWTYRISKEKLAALNGLSQINKIDLFQDKPSGKVYGLRIKSGSDKRDVDFFTLQSKLSQKNLPSNDFTINSTSNDVEFKGFGKGHGVGLCLYSASQMAQNGDMAVKILSKFFPGTYIVNLAAYPLDLKPEKESQSPLPKGKGL